MSLIKKWSPKMFTKKSASILASFVLIIVKVTANSICMVPFYEPKQPEELQHLKIKR